MKHPVRMFILAATTLLVLAASGVVRADTVGSLLDHLAQRAAKRVTEKRPRHDAPAAPATQQDDAAASASGDAHDSAPAGVEPWPTNAGARNVVRPAQFIFAAPLLEQKQRFREASSFACASCEGGRDVDSWRKAFGHPHETYSSWSAILETWTVGRTIPWRGTAHDGSITVLSDVPVGGFACRQLRHRITSRGKPPVSVERPGLICLGKQDAYSSRETWHEVF